MANGIGSRVDRIAETERHCYHEYWHSSTAFNWIWISEPTRESCEIFGSDSRVSPTRLLIYRCVQRKNAEISYRFVGRPVAAVRSSAHTHKAQTEAQTRVSLTGSHCFPLFSLCILTNCMNTSPLFYQSVCESELWVSVRCLSGAQSQLSSQWWLSGLSKGESDAERYPHRWKPCECYECDASLPCAALNCKHLIRRLRRPSRIA